MACSLVFEGSCCSVVDGGVGITWGLSSSESSESLSELLESSSSLESSLSGWRDGGFSSSVSICDFWGPAE